MLAFEAFVTSLQLASSDTSLVPRRRPRAIDPKQGKQANARDILALSPPPRTLSRVLIIVGPTTTSLAKKKGSAFAPNP